MKYNLPLDQMSTAEKLELMEALWMDLSKNPADIPIPAWHEEALHQREQDLREGRDQIRDWEDVKKELLNSVKKK
jgi:hypothetical protein